ncbi:MAG TPA: autotransporter-associated beta strand repeat-containing protein [Chthoniobacteraceae bacterium]|nr:autotransporter-associated beta strand repeat-containing protein [Chthoniobacteraceae bacterium]
MVLALGCADSSVLAATWTGAGGSDLWSDASNWQGNILPGNGDEVVFGRNGGGDSIANYTLSLTAFRFTPEILPAHDIRITASLTLSGFGIHNQSRIPGFGEPQIPPGVIRQQFYIEAAGTMTFQNSATVTGNLPVDLNAQNGGRIVFEDNSTASGPPDYAFTILRAYGAAVAGGLAGELRFKDDAKMGETAGFLTAAGQVAGALGGLAVFEGRSMASGNVSNTTSDGFGGRIIFRENAVGGGSLGLSNFGAVHTGAGAEAVTQFLDDSALSGVIQNFAGQGAGSLGARVEFRQNARFDGTPVPPELGSILILNNGSFDRNNVPGTAGLGGQTVFYDDSRILGANVYITNNTESEGPNPGGVGGTTDFLDRSRAGAATINNSGASSGAAGTLGGRTFFRGNSNAESANIFASGGSQEIGAPGGFVEFSGASTAAGATLTALGGTDGASGGKIMLIENANGAAARVVTETGGVFDMSGLTSAGTTLGSIEGGGTFFLGSRALTVGSAGLNTEVMGVISDGGQGGGSGATLTKVGASVLTLRGANTFTGTTTVSAGVLLVNGSLGSAPVSVAGLATLGGSGTIGGAVVVANDGRIAPGGPGFGTLTVGALTLSPSAQLDFQLRTAGAIGGGVNDLLEVNGALTFDGILNIGAPMGLTLGAYRLINYSGVFADNGVTVGTVAVGTSASDFTLQTSVPGQVNLVLGGETDVLFWDGAQVAANNFVDGGAGTWNNAATNWTNSAGSVQRGWNGRTAVFSGAAGTVTLGDNVSTRGMQFATTGYIVNASAGAAMTLDGAVPLRVDSAVSVTIHAPLTGVGSLHKIGIGTLTLAGNSGYTGGTTITDGGVFVRNAVGLAFGSGPVAVLASPTSELSFLDNSSAGLITFTNAGSGPAGDAGLIALLDTANAAGATFINLGNTGDTGTGGTLRFGSSSRANAATIENRGAAFSSPAAGFSGGGQTLFSQSALAESARITNFAGLGSGLQGGRTVFTNSASANGAAITNRGGQVAGALGGWTTFSGNASANSATLIADGGANGGLGGLIVFSGTSLGGTARVILGAGDGQAGTLDLSALGTGILTLGSIEGGGRIFLGAKGLTFGSNNLSTEFAGTISEAGGSVAGVGGNISKQGAGTVTLSGNNSYTGTTFILGGELVVRNALGRGLGTGQTETVPGATLRFVGDSLAGATSLIVNRSAGLTVFEDDASAGTVRITNHLDAGAGSGGTTRFLERSTAATAQLTNLGGDLTNNALGGVTQFYDGATAGSAIVSNEGGRFTFASGGLLEFFDQATGGAATVANAAGMVAEARGGVAIFREMSLAGAARITNAGATVAKAFGGSVAFDFGSGSADRATIINQGATTTQGPTGFSPRLSAGYAQFFPGSSAGTATITNEGGLANGASGGFTEFTSLSSAAQATVLNKGGMVSGALGGLTTLQGSGGSATFTNEAGGFVGSFGGSTSFTGTANAGTAAILNRASAVAGAFPGDTNFFGSAQAGESVIHSEGAAIPGADSGQLRFLNSSSADRATLYADAGVGTAAGGGIVFYNTSEGGTARAILGSDGAGAGFGGLDISFLTDSGMSIGSIEGGGVVSLGRRNLAVGGNDLTTEFSGLVRDGGFVNESGGSLTKVGTGTLVLSGTNTYTGTTTVVDGILRVTGSLAGSVEVQGGVLGGNGMFNGGVVVGPGGVVAPGASIGAFETAGPLSLASDATFQLEIDSFARNADQITAGGVTLASGARLAPLELAPAFLPPGFRFTVIENASLNPIAGTFAGFPEGGEFDLGANRFRISYTGGTGNDITLTNLIPEPGTALFVLLGGVSLCLTRARRAA